MGQKIGVLGKEGGSGGWSHLHFEITSRQPSGKWGTQEGYAFLWQAALREQKPDVIAVARPHRLAWAGEPVVLDGSKSWSRSGPIARFEWTFSDGTTATGPRVERTYDRPGAYSEILKVTDRPGHVDYDFADRPGARPRAPRPAPADDPRGVLARRPGSSPATRSRSRCGPSGRPTARRPGTSATARPPVEVQSDGNVDQHAHDGYAVTTHRFEKPGHYLVRVERTDRRGATATARLHVVVEGTRGDCGNWLRGVTRSPPASHVRPGIRGRYNGPRPPVAAGCNPDRIRR